MKYIDVKILWLFLRDQDWTFIKKTKTKNHDFISVILRRQIDINSLFYLSFQILFLFLFTCPLFLFFSFLWNLLGWHWLIGSYRFQVYISMTHYLHIALCAHHPNVLISPRCIYIAHAFISTLPLWVEFLGFRSPRVSKLILFL